MSVDLAVVDAFASAHGEDAAAGRATDFMLALLDGVTRPMPDVARHGVAVARAFRAGTASAAALEAARVACWEYVDSRGGSTGDPQPENACVRAVICTLFDGPQAGGDAGDAIDNFLDFADVFDSRPGEAQALLARFFASEPQGVGA